jgi:hypothetical protein
MATKKIVLKKNKTLDKIWHPESSLVFKSAKEKIVIGRCVDDCLVCLDQEALELCTQWKFKYDKELIDECEEEQDEGEEGEEQDEEDEDQEKLKKVIDKHEEDDEKNNKEEEDEDKKPHKVIDRRENTSVKNDDLKSVECNITVKKEIDAESIVDLSTYEKCSSNYESLLKVCVLFIENIKTVVGELEKNNSTTLLNCQKDYDKIIDEKNNLLKKTSDTLEVTTKELEDTKQKLSNIKKALGL